MNPSTPTQIIEPYLFFNGACDEAIAFYQEAIGAEVLMAMRYRESPAPMPPGTLPAGFENKIMHATLRIGGSILMASDGCTDSHSAFQGFSLSLRADTIPRAKAYFQALAKGGTVQMPIAETFWSPCFGMVVDRFGVPWMVTVADSAPSASSASV